VRLQTLSRAGSSLLLRTGGAASNDEPTGPRRVTLPADPIDFMKELGDIDVIVVGTGPGGSSVGRDLARAGKRVVMLEFGKDHRGRWYYGTPFGPLVYSERRGFLRSKEGVTIVRPMLTGGATNMFAGSASEPPDWWRAKTGIDLGPEAQETIDELRLRPVPQELRGSASHRIAEAGRALGQDWQPQMKFLDTTRCAGGFDCGAKCMYGCRCGAKWTANEYMDQAIAAGATVLTECNVREVMIEDGAATGVRGTLKGQPFELKSKVVVVSAGGIGTPRILQNSGIAEAGDKLAVDTTFVIYGIANERGNCNDTPMASSYCDDDNGLFYSILAQPRALFTLTQYYKGWRELYTATKFPRMLSIMVKIKEDLKGYVAPDGEISMPVTEEDQKRAHRGFLESKRVLIKAGCDPDTISWNPPRGTHPCGSVRIGEHLDGDLKTQFENLYVCDASTFPDALVRGPALTVISLGKRLAKHLSGSVLAETKTTPLRAAAAE